MHRSALHVGHSCSGDSDDACCSDIYSFYPIHATTPTSIVDAPARETAPESVTTFLTESSIVDAPARETAPESVTTFLTESKVACPARSPPGGGPPWEPAARRGSEADPAGDGVLPDAGGAGVAADDLQGRPAAGRHQLLVGGDGASLDRGAGAQAVTAVPERRLQPGPAGGALHRAVDGQVGEARGALDRGGGVVADPGARVDGPEGRPVVEAGGRAPGEPRPDGAGLRVVAVGDRADVDAGLGIALAAVDRVVDADLEPLRDQDEVAD